MIARAITSPASTRLPAFTALAHVFAWAAHIVRRFDAAWSEAQDLARATHRRFPFADW